MKVIVIVASLILLSTAYKGTSDENSDSEFDSGDTTLVKFDSKKYLDMEGRLKRNFAVEAALAAPERNMVCSPISALLPIGKLALGARGDALNELYKAVGVKEQGKLKKRFRKLIRLLQYLPGVTLDVASRLYVSSHAKIKASFHSKAKDIFKSSCEKVDFSAPQRAAESINAWVAKQTNGMIPDIISPADITPKSSLIMVNAVYFKGKWKHPFTKVESGTFNSPRGQRKVPIMQQKATHNYHLSTLLNAEIIELPYANDKASFVIVLPYKQDGLTILLNELNVVPHVLSSEMGKMKKTKMNITMPKFKLQTDLDLKNLYQKIGVRAIFGGHKALPDIVEKTSLEVSRGVQKAIIEVTELGTEAAAASTSVIKPVAFVETKHILVDHPFLFIVKMKYQQLFVGILNDPIKF